VKLLLIRHSEPDPKRDTLDPPLSDEGRSLAADTAEWLVGEGVSIVYSSDTRRARETAEVIAARVGAPLVVEDGLAEFGGGYEYVPVDELRRTDDARWAAMAAGDLTVYGTDADTFRAGVSAALETIVAAHPGDTVAVVCHAGVINAYLGGVLGIDRLLWVELNYASISRLAVSRSGVRSLVSLNEQPHGCGLPSSDQAISLEDHPVVEPSESVLSTRRPGGPS
jgi:2,3-bisphosphoglycerate-dependent phosphoglycerate mutase